MSQEKPMSVAILDPQETESGQRQVSYFLKSAEYSGDAPHTGFGIEARLYAGARLVEGAEVGDVTCSQSEAEEMIELLARHTVTPVTLKDVIEDLISG